MPNTQVIHSVVTPQELVSDKLLSEVGGDVLFIHSVHGTTICERSVEDMRQQSLSWLVKADTEKASFIAGHVSEKGGRFQIITKDQAVELLAVWVFEEVQHAMD